VSQKFDWLNFVLSGIVSLVVAVVSGVIQYAINRETIEASRSASATALALEKNIAEEQVVLAKQLAELEAWRETPRIKVLQSVQPTKCNVVATIQNEGGKQLVLFAIRTEWLTPLNEPKYGGVPSNEATFVDTADRSKAISINLNSKTLDIPYTFDLPIVIAPGEVLTLNIELNPLSRSCFLHLNSTDPHGWTELGMFRQPP
jgi:hypothetical protein